uniref:Endonuclease 8-like 1 n=1 Tax=Geotrypetes seraphini TaxID=260995 RepID=A0A6P8PMQ0_GEOSA|nr:endonuclease 8-like 1 [Geotrypetes seraphini]XP_033776799.1 endonuclease 8-like 1 [Geotrypetes seraphini]XP_033776800.1 endonuclease 8-like 1 [Geotrypetes seraphini]XP_033776801.1 endonuclease 8-like 1 [Geotrypetes seraphini]
MPEGPELHLASRYINRVCAGLIFSGKVEKSDVSKNPEVPFENAKYLISAVSRGKEVKLNLTPVKEEKKSGRLQGTKEPIDIVFRFGMSGHFMLSPATELPKHAHLRFYTKDSPRQALCFVDMRRFGRWEAPGTWQPDRGPCVMLEYEKFRENVLRNLAEKAFDRPICEALLNQKYFNGVGNYLRAEILHRLKIPPFVKARTVLEPLLQQDQDAELTLSKKVKIKKENPDLLELCHSVPMEAIQLGPEGFYPIRREDFSIYEKWLQCYFVPGMKTLRDSSGRTIWFQGEAGPLAPKAAKSKTKRRGMKAKPETPSPKIIKTETEQDSKNAKTQADGTGRGKDKKGKLGRMKSKKSEIKAGQNANENVKKQTNLKAKKRKLQPQDLSESNPPVTKRVERSRQRLESQDSSGNLPATKKRQRGRSVVDTPSWTQDSSKKNCPAVERKSQRSAAKRTGSNSKAQRPRRGHVK